MKENIVIFSLLFSLKNNKENKGKREGQRGGKFCRGIYCAHYFYQFCSASSPLGLQSTLLLKGQKEFYTIQQFFIFFIFFKKKPRQFLEIIFENNFWNLNYS